MYSHHKRFSQKTKQNKKTRSVVYQNLIAWTFSINLMVQKASNHVIQMSVTNLNLLMQHHATATLIPVTMVQLHIAHTKYFTKACNKLVTHAYLHTSDCNQSTSNIIFHNRQPQSIPVMVKTHSAPLPAASRKR